MGCQQSKGVPLNNDKKRGLKSTPTSPVSTGGASTTSSLVTIDYEFNMPSSLTQLTDPGEQLYELLSMAATCEDAYVWAKTVKMCELHPSSAFYIDERSGDTPLHAACRAIGVSGGNTGNLDVPASTTAAVRALIRLAPNTVSRSNIEGNIPLHFCLAPSTICPSNDVNDCGYQNSVTIRADVVNILIASDHEASQAYLGRTDVAHGCTPLYLTVSSLPDDFFSPAPGPTVSLIKQIHSTLPSMVSARNDGDHDTPLALLYRRFSRQFDSSEKFFPGDNSRREVVQYRQKYKAAAMNTWKIILELLSPVNRDRSDFCIVHAAVGLGCCPPDLLRYVIETRPDEVRMADESGRLPLHHAASAPTLLGNGSGYHAKFVMDELLYAFPDGAAYANADGKLPLRIAIEAEKSWIGGGVKSLYDVYPDAMEQLELENHPGIKRAMSFSSQFILHREEDDEMEEEYCRHPENIDERERVTPPTAVKEEHYDAIMMVQRPNADLGNVVSAMWANEEDGGVQMLGCVSILQIVRNRLSVTKANENNNEKELIHTVLPVALTAVTAVVNAMKNHPNEPAVQEKACGALRVLAPADGNMEVSMAASGAAASIVAAMQSHVSDAIVQREACAALRDIVKYGGGDRATVIASVSGFTAIQNAMGAHPNVAGVQSGACDVLEVLTAFPDANLPDLPGAQTAPLLELAATRFPDDCIKSAGKVLERLS